jgi:hypothetical protein
VSRLALIAALAGFALSCRKTEDEAAIRKREAAEIESKVSSTKVGLYRAVKTSLRALPPSDAVRRAVEGKTELTRDEWATLLAADPVLAPHKDRVGVFVAGVRLREALLVSAHVLVAFAAAKAGGHVAGGIEASPLPKTADPFGSPLQLAREVKALLADDEDTYPTLAVSLMPSATQEKIRAADARSLVGRLAVPAFEHVVLGLAWMELKPEFALYELRRADSAALLPVEQALLHGARMRRYLEGRWFYHALDELAAFEKVLPAFQESIPGADGEDVLAAGTAVAAVLRYQCYLSLKREADAKAELERAAAVVKDRERLKAVGHLIAAKVHVDAREFKKASAELRSAAELLPEGDPRRAEILAVAKRIEEELPDSFAPADLAAFLWRQAWPRVSSSVVPAEVGEGARGLRGAVSAKVEEWEGKVPTLDDVREKLKR